MTGAALEEGVILVGKKGVPLKASRLGQVGIVVNDIDKTIDYFKSTFGIQPWSIVEAVPDVAVARGEAIDMQAKMAMAQAGSVQLELIEPLAEIALYSDFLKEKGEGLHHLGFFVRNIKERLAEAERTGIEVLLYGKIAQLGLTVEYVYLDTTPIGGVIMEFIQVSFLGIALPMWAPILTMGTRLQEKLGL